MCTKSHPENLEYRPELLGDIPKKSQTSRNFGFITSCLLENFPSLPIPGKIFRFQEEFCFPPETALLRVDTPHTQSLTYGQLLLCVAVSLIYQERIASIARFRSLLKLKKKSRSRTTTSCAPETEKDIVSKNVSCILGERNRESSRLRTIRKLRGYASDASFSTL